MLNMTFTFIKIRNMQARKHDRRQLKFIDSEQIIHLHIEEKGL